MKKVMTRAPHPLERLCRGLCNSIPPGRWIPATAAAEAFSRDFYLRGEPPLELYDVIEASERATGGSVIRTPLSPQVRGFNSFVRSGHGPVGYILYSDQENRQTAKMTILHEVAEVLFRELVALRPDMMRMTHSRREAWATEFASMVLAPPNIFLDKLIRYNFHAVLLADKFDMSDQAILVRMSMVLRAAGSPFYGGTYSWRETPDGLAVTCWWSTPMRVFDDPEASFARIEDLIARSVEEESELHRVRLDSSGLVLDLFEAGGRRAVVSASDLSVREALVEKHDTHSGGFVSIGELVQAYCLDRLGAA